MRRRILIGAVLLILLSLTGVGWMAASSEAPATEYLVEPRDTLAAICSRFRLRISDVQAANPGLDARRLRVGQRILIPGQPLIVRVARRLDPLAAKAGLGNKSLENAAFRFIDWRRRP